MVYSFLEENLDETQEVRTVFCADFFFCIPYDEKIYL